MLNPNSSPGIQSLPFFPQRCCFLKVDYHQKWIWRFRPLAKSFDLRGGGGNLFPRDVIAILPVFKFFTPHFLWLNFKPNLIFPPYFLLAKPLNPIFHPQNPSFHGFFMLVYLYFSWEKPIEKPWKKTTTFSTFSHRRLRLFGLVPSRRFRKLRRHGMEVAPGRSADLRAVRGINLSKNGGVDHGKNGGFNHGKTVGSPFNQGKCWV